MDAKYAGKSVVLPKELSDGLEAYRAELSDDLGFKVSLSDAIGRLLKLHKEEIESE